MTRICLMVVWMGPFTKEYRLWLNSVEKNPTIDFYVITDQEKPVDCPSNVFYIKSSLKEVKAKFEENLGMKIRLERPYKLCDYKPIWWMLMDERLYNYDFYGHCDVDLVFGDLRHFLTEDFLSEYDKCFDTGYFILYRNNEEMRNLFRRSLDKDNAAYPYKKAFKTDFACYFDEFMGMSILSWQYKKGYVDQLKEDYIQDFSWKRLDFNSYITHKSFVIHWINGKLYRVEVDESGNIIEDLSNGNMGKELLLVHIQKRKMDICFNVDDKNEASDYWIYPNKYTREKPNGILYTEKEKAEYAEKIRISDRKKQWKNLKQYGIIQYIPHFLRTRKIRKFIRTEKGYF